MGTPLVEQSKIIEEKLKVLDDLCGMLEIDNCDLVSTFNRLDSSLTEGPDKPAEVSPDANHGSHIGRLTLLLKRLGVIEGEYRHTVSKFDKII